MPAEEPASEEDMSETMSQAESAVAVEGLDSSSMPARTDADRRTFSPRSFASTNVRGGPLTRIPAPLKISGWLMWLDQFLRSAGSLMKSVPTSCARSSSDMRDLGGQRYSRRLNPLK